jgi:hypothetical protein
MAPEQAAGRTQEADPRADVYALGSILYELVTGCTPYPAETAIEVVMHKLAQEPPSPRSVRPGLGRDVERIILKAMARERERRYSTARALQEDMERCLRGEPVRAEGERGREVVRALFAVASGILAGLLVAGALCLVLGTGLTPPGVTLRGVLGFSLIAGVLGALAGLRGDARGRAASWRAVTSGLAATLADFWLWDVFDWLSPPMNSDDVLAICGWAILLSMSAGAYRGWTRGLRESTEAGALPAAPGARLRTAALAFMGAWSILLGAKLASFHLTGRLGLPGWTLTLPVAAAIAALAWRTRGRAAADSTASTLCPHRLDDRAK